MDPQQDIFIKIKKAIVELGYDVYDCGLPPEGTAYPFVYLGDVSIVEYSTKSQGYEDISATIHVWSNNPKKRGDLSEMLSNIRTVCRTLGPIIRSLDQRILPDNTTKEPLLHGVIEVIYRV